MLVVDSVGLPAKHAFEGCAEHPHLEAGQRSKQKKKKDVQETHFALTPARRKLFTTGKCKPSLPAPKHGGFTSLIMAVRFHSVNSKLLIYKMSCFSWKEKKEDGEMYKPSQVNAVKVKIGYSVPLSNTRQCKILKSSQSLKRKNQRKPVLKSSPKWEGEKKWSQGSREIGSMQKKFADNDTHFYGTKTVMRHIGRIKVSSCHFYQNHLGPSFRHLPSA